MIKVYFPPGCYGTYLARCLYNYTDLRVTPFRKFNFSSTGSSHYHHNDAYAKSIITQGHIDTMTFDNSDKVVSILPCKNHNLDYYNNQFFKQQRGRLVSYVLTQMSLEEAEHKLQTQWHYTGKFDDQTPRWIIREWCSLWIANALESGYDATKYSNLPAVATITTQDIFENYAEVLDSIISVLGLTVNIDTDIIHAQHREFLELQKFHNSQNKCEQYVQDLLAGNDREIVVHSIFDEAYIQHLLRQHNLEMRCDGVDVFPNTIMQLKNLTYKN